VLLVLVRKEAPMPPARPMSRRRFRSDRDVLVAKSLYALEQTGLSQLWSPAASRQPAATRSG